MVLNDQSVDASCGIIATGKNCFANVVIQLLNSITDLRQAIIELNAPAESLTGTLCRIFGQLEAMQDNISSEELIIGAGFPNTDHEDAADMLQKLLNDMTDYAAHNEDTRQQFNNLLSWQNSYDITCTVHGPLESKQLHDSGNIISIPIKDVKTLLEGIRGYVQKPDSDWQ